MRMEGDRWMGGERRRREEWDIGGWMESGIEGGKDGGERTDGGMNRWNEGMRGMDRWGTNRRRDGQIGVDGVGAASVAGGGMTR